MSIFDNYEQELLTQYQTIKQTDREAFTVRWKAERQAEIDAGLRDANGEWIGPDLVEEDELEEDEDEDSDSEEESDL